MHVCKCLRSLRARSTWPTSGWPLCSSASSYERSHTQYTDRNISHWYMRSLTLYTSIDGWSCSLAAFSRLLVVSGQRRREREQSIIEWLTENIVRWPSSMLTERERENRVTMIRQKTIMRGTIEPISQREFSSSTYSVLFSIQSRTFVARERETPHWTTRYCTVCSILCCSLVT